MARLNAFYGNGATPAPRLFQENMLQLQEGYADHPHAQSVQKAKAHHQLLGSAHKIDADLQMTGADEVETPVFRHGKMFDKQLLDQFLENPNLDDAA